MISKEYRQKPESLAQYHQFIPYRQLDTASFSFTSHNIHIQMEAFQ